MIQTSEQIDAISAALVKAQAEIENVEKSGSNPAFKREGQPTKYATLGGALDEVRPKFAKHGVYIMQAAINGDGPNIGVTTRLLHLSGQWIESTLYVAPTKFDAQGAGSVITYLRRYALMAMAGIAPEDDDGNAAVAQPQPQRAGMVRAADVPRAGPSDPRTGFVGNGNGNGATELPLAEDTRIRNIITKLDSIIKNADSSQRLAERWDGELDEFKIVENAGDRGRAAADALRAKYNKRMVQLEDIPL